MSQPTITVVIAQRQIPHYRVPFLAKLRCLLGDDGIELRLLTGNYYEDHLIPGELQGTHVLPTHRVGPFLWNGFNHHCLDAELVIIPQQIKQLDLFDLWLRRRFQSKPLLALWGHGKNFQSAAQGGGKDCVKRFISRRVDWWFAYNDLSARVVADLGFPTERITSVGNAVDTTGMQRRLREVAPQEIAALREEHGISSENIAIYTGGLYPNKRIEFLLEAARLIRAAIPDFELIMIGDGPERGKVTEAARAEPWIHDIGPKGDDGKVPFWAMAKLLLMPGLVGLVVVDSFALGVPLVTTDFPFHSPEIDYLKDGENGCVIGCGEDAGVYAEAVISLFQTPERLAALKEGAIRSSGLHTIENMAKNFAEGVTKCLVGRTRLKTAEGL